MKGELQAFFSSRDDQTSIDTPLRFRYLNRKQPKIGSNQTDTRRALLPIRAAFSSFDWSPNTMSFLAEIWNSFKSTVRGFDTPHQLALGLTLGLAIGLLPKDSLLPYALGVIAILTPGNLFCLAIGITATSFLSIHLDPVTHPIGSWILTYQPLQTTWSWLHELPMAPWTRFNNTVVMGNLALGLALALPIYLLSRTLFAKFGPSIFKLVVESRLARKLTDKFANPDATTQLQES